MAGKTSHETRTPRGQTLRNGCLAALLVAAVCIGALPAAADYPLIAELNSRDVLYRQLQDDLQSYFRAASRTAPDGSPSATPARSLAPALDAPPLRLFSYRNDGSMDLFALAARLNLPYDTLATLNGVSTPATVKDQPTLLIPNLPGLFVRQQPRSSFEEILYSVTRSQRGAAQTVRVGSGGSAQLFWFYPGENFTAVERAFFLNILFRFPLPFARLSSRYGVRENPLTGEEEFHQGIDLAAPEGTEVYAARDGVVVACGADPVLGNLVIIEHEAGYRTVYGHLRRIAVGLKQQVRSGIIVGEVGTTGRSTGPHLHFEIRRGGSAKDPSPLLPLPKDE